MTDRRETLATNLRAVRERVAKACAAADRAPSSVTLVAVTKTHPASDVRRLAELGVTDVGENRDQEASGKARACGDLDLAWHFVGQLQTNKCRSVASYAHVVHSVDRVRLATTLGREARRAGRVLRCLVQVDLGQGGGDADTPSGSDGAGADRAGADPADVHRVADTIADADGLVLGGVMAMAPLGEEPGPAFQHLAAVAADLRARHPRATDVSAGMTGDFEAAIGCGATHVRVGTALLGHRGGDVG